MIIQIDVLEELLELWSGRVRLEGVIVWDALALINQEEGKGRRSWEMEFYRIRDYYYMRDVIIESGAFCGVFSHKEDGRCAEGKHNSHSVQLGPALHHLYRISFMGLLEFSLSSCTLEDGMKLIIRLLDHRKSEDRNGEVHCSSNEPQVLLGLVVGHQRSNGPSDNHPRHISRSPLEHISPVVDLLLGVLQLLPNNGVSNTHIGASSSKEYRQNSRCLIEYLVSDITDLV